MAEEKRSLAVVINVIIIIILIFSVIYLYQNYLEDKVPGGTEETAVQQDKVESVDFSRKFGITVFKFAALLAVIMGSMILVAYLINKRSRHM